MPTKGDLQYVCGIGNFEFDGDSWYRQTDDIRYTVEHMRIVIAQNDQATGVGS